MFFKMRKAYVCRTALAGEEEERSARPTFLE
jgi:hypothetical protein